MTPGDIPIHGPCPTIINPCGYTLRPTGEWEGHWPFRKVRKYEFTLSHHTPLTFWSQERGKYIRPDRHGFTDMGSIPVGLQWLFQKDAFLVSYIFHDSAWREGGLYFSDAYGGPYIYQEMHRSSANGLLVEMIEAEGGMWITRNVIWAAVTVCGRESKAGNLT
jgi:hypothetical protein